MKRTYYIFFILLTIAVLPVKAQKVDSIFFNLYTDSLKKGQHNYINVDAKLKNGQWLPLTDKQLLFACPDAKFEGNELIIPEDFPLLKTTITATLKSDPSVTIQRTVWIKQSPDPALPTREEIMKGSKKRK